MPRRAASWAASRPAHFAQQGGPMPVELLGSDSFVSRASVGVWLVKALKPGPRLLWRAKNG